MKQAYRKNRKNRLAKRENTTFQLEREPGENHHHCRERLFGIQQATGKQYRKKRKRKDCLVAVSMHAV